MKLLAFRSKMAKLHSNADISDPPRMPATLGQPRQRFAEFAVEAKYNGQRGMAVVEGGAVTLLSRKGADITRTFPEITSALAAATSAWC